MKPELVLHSCAELGEGPAWDARLQILYWVDIYAGNLHIFNPKNGTDRYINIGEFIGCATPRRTGGLVLALKSGFASLDPFTGALTRLKNPEPHLPGNRFNDGKCDPAGRFLAGSMDDAEIEASGSLYSLTSDGQVKRLLTGVRISNGLAWSPDYHTFYYIDTPTRTVVAYEYDLDCGEIAHPRPVIHIPPELGWPDGMTSDSEGMLWVALWGGAKVTRWNPTTGRMIMEIVVPAFNVSSCVFGGADLTDLYVTTARKGMNTEQLAQYPLSGGLFHIKTAIRGMPTFEFNG